MGRLGIRWGHLDQSEILDSDGGLCLLGRGFQVPGYLSTGDTVQGSIRVHDAVPQHFRT